MDKLTQDDVLDAYYFVENKLEPLSELIEDYPSIFQKEKMTPLNFQLRMSHMVSDTRSRKSANRLRLSTQSAVTKVDLRAKMISDVLQNRDKFNIFELFNSSEDSDDKIWYFIDQEKELCGPFSNDEINQEFINDKLKYNTLIKTKMGPDFTMMCHLLNKFCRKKLVKKFEKSEGVEKMLEKSNQMSAMDGINLINDSSLEPWLKVIGKRPEIVKSRTNFVSTNNRNKKCVSVSFKTPELFDARSLGTNDKYQNLFDEMDKKQMDYDQRGWKKTGEGRSKGGFGKMREKRNSMFIPKGGKNRKRGSLLERGEDDSSGRGIRPRMATANFSRKGKAFKY